MFTEHSFLSCRFGSIYVAFDIEYAPNATEPNSKLIATVKRGKLGTLKVNPNSLVITELGKICEQFCLSGEA